MRPLLRRSFREDGKVRNETVANLSHLPADLIDVVRRSLSGEAFVPALAVATVTPVAVAWTRGGDDSAGRRIGPAALLGPPVGAVIWPWH